MAEDVPWITGKLIDITTMEVMLGSHTFIPDDKRYRRRYGRNHDGTVGNATRYSTPYTLFFRPAFPILSRLTGAQLHCLYWVCDQIEPNADGCPTDIVALSDALNVGLARAANLLSEVVASGLLIRPARGRVAFNPEYIWCGGAGKREAAVHSQRRSADDDVEHP